MSFEIQDPNVGAVSLTAAILLYGNRESGSFAASFATLHPVRMDGEKPVIAPGKPVDRAGVLALSKSLSKRRKTARCGFLSENILSIGAGHLVWYQAATTRTVYFSCTDKGDGSVGQRTGSVPLPTLVFAASRNSLSVFAVKDRGRPLSSTPLFHAPFFNVWEDGMVCTGNAMLPCALTPDSIPDWDRAFYKSHFSHTNHAKVVRFKGGAHAFWNALLDGKFQRFPNAVLTAFPNPLTVAALIEIVEGKE